MSIRIHNGNLAGPAPSPSTRPDESLQASGSSGKVLSSSIAAGEDRVEISALSEGVDGANRALEAGDASRVQRLAALYQTGAYQVDSLQVSRALVSDAIGGHGLEGND
jgi:hypothetical protein